MKWGELRLPLFFLPDVIIRNAATVIFLSDTEVISKTDPVIVYTRWPLVSRTLVIVYAMCGTDCKTVKV